MANSNVMGMGVVMKLAFAMMSFAFSMTALAAPHPTQAVKVAAKISTEEVVKAVTSQQVVLQGLNSKGELGADEFGLKMSKGRLMRANLRSSTTSDISKNPRAFQVIMNLSTPAGTTPVMKLTYAGESKETAAHSRTITYATPAMTSPYAGKGRLVAVVNQTKSNDGWRTNRTFIRYLSK